MVHHVTSTATRARVTADESAVETSYRDCKKKNASTGGMAASRSQGHAHAPRTDTITDQAHTPPAVNRSATSHTTTLVI